MTLDLCSFKNDVIVRDVRNDKKDEKIIDKKNKIRLKNIV